jgi:DNA invertase Pin-like site-specific DNA recombinase
MKNAIPAIYGRQSVDKMDSISIESQLEFCKYELKGGSYREYTDKGFSGKNTDRPKFQEMVRDIEQGHISKVVVYKLDRISRSIIDFARMMELFGRYNVEFVSATEKFDTSTPIGRAMLNICIVFAQLERETIQQRVTDSYYSRCHKGFHMSGRVPYGYKPKPAVINGINANMYEADTEAANRVKMMFDMYAEPQTSFGDVVRYLCNDGTGGKEFSRVALAAILKNPVYAQADLDIYEFFKSQGTDISNDAADFTGTNGCFLFQGRDVATSKRVDLKDQILVVAPHEGLIPSDTWLACRKKLMNNTTFKSGRKAATSWISGKIKCGRCGSGLTILRSIADVLYLRCRRRADRKSCEGCGTLHVVEVEKIIYAEMCSKMSQFQTLTDDNASKANPKLTALHTELAQVETEIEKLLNTLTGANAVLMSYANDKINELDAKRQSLSKTIAEMTADALSPKQMKQITGYLNDWDNVSTEDMRIVLNEMVSKVSMTSQSFQIEWKI